MMETGDRNCVATPSYVYDHAARELPKRLTQDFHAHHAGDPSCRRRLARVRMTTIMNVTMTVVISMRRPIAKGADRQ